MILSIIGMFVTGLAIYGFIIAFCWLRDITGGWSGAVMGSVALLALWALAHLW